MNSSIDFSKIKPVRLEGGGFLRGAHHPHCDRHHNHLIWIMGHPLCLGCTCMYSGMVVGLGISLVLPWSSMPFELWLLFHLLLLIPTSLQPWIQKKLYKITSRFLLGICVSSYFLSGLVLISPPYSEWIFRVSVLAFYLIASRFLRFIRNRYTYNPCDDCPLGVFPTCDWNLPRLMRENEDIDLSIMINQKAQN